MPDRDHARHVVRRPMNDHDTMTLEVCETNETRHVCEYATPELKRQLEAVPADTTIPLAMSRVGIRANVWRAVAIDPSRSVAGTPSDGDTRTKQTL